MTIDAEPAPWEWSTNFGAPARMTELWDWVEALYEFEFGDRKPLGAMLRSGLPIPPEFLVAVAEIVEGVRKPKAIAVAKRKIPAREALQAARRIDLMDQVCASVSNKSLLESASDDLRVDPIKVLREFQGAKRRAIEEEAQRFDVSVETIENLLRDIRRRVKRWPAV